MKSAKTYLEKQKFLTVILASGCHLPWFDRSWFAYEAVDPCMSVVNIPYEIDPQNKLVYLCEITVKDPHIATRSFLARKHVQMVWRSLVLRSATLLSLLMVGLANNYSSCKAFMVHPKHNTTLGMLSDGL